MSVKTSPLCSSPNSTSLILPSWHLALTRGPRESLAARLPVPRLPALTFRVGPEQVTHGPIMRHLLLPVNCPDLVQGLDGGGEAAMHAEDL